MHSSTIHEYNKYSDNLFDLITDCKQKRPAFQKILQKLETHSFLIEEDYVDKDHLVDYTSFYARCHIDYKRLCKRVHFFKHDGETSGISFLESTFSDLSLVKLDSDLIERLNGLYLGFIVIKSLKDKPSIGRTCLKSYREEGSRNYPAIREYKVNLYGIPIALNTMAFQEQDGTTGVCASIALWSAFQITGVKFQHPIPSPSEITALALSHTPYMRANQGLDAKLISTGIAKIGLNSLILHTRGFNHTQSVVYAYLKAGIPVISVLDLYDTDQNGKREAAEHLSHAITFNGYSFEVQKEDFSNHEMGVNLHKDMMRIIPFAKEIHFYSRRITKLYAHDDQLCPFSKLTFNSVTNTIKSFWLRSGIEVPSEDISDYRSADVRSLIIPLPEKVRITHDEVIKGLKFELKRLSKVFEALTKIGLPVKSVIEWDVFLTNVNDFKREILDTEEIFYPTKNDLLRKSLPKYLWRTRAIVSNSEGSTEEILFEFVFDATDSNQGRVSNMIVIYNQEINKLYQKLILTELYEKDEYNN